MRDNRLRRRPAGGANPLSREPLAGTIGIAHTRWATHGIPSDGNSHPHLDCRGQVAVVHNGIIENYAELRQVLIERGQYPHFMLKEINEAPTVVESASGSWSA